MDNRPRRNEDVGQPALEGEIEKQFLSLFSYREDKAKFRAEFRKLWSNQNSISLGESLSGTEFQLESDHASKAYCELLKMVDNIGVFLANQNFPFTKNETEFLVVNNRLYLALNVLRTGLVSLPDLIAEESLKHRGTRMETVNFFIFAASLRELPATGEAAILFKEWEKVAAINDPIWQYLAIKGAAKGISADGSNNLSSEKLDFYKRFSSSQNTLVQQEALGQIGNLGLIEGEFVIEETMKNGQIHGDEDRQAALDNVRKSQFIRRLREAEDQ